MKIEIVTPAGRKKTLSILFKNLQAQKEHFDIWTLWLNTTNREDIDYCKSLEKKYSWIKTIDLSVPYSETFSIYSFFKHACNPNILYIRLDDDIVWLEPNFIKNLSDFRSKNPQYFLVYGNIINNSIIDHLHQRYGNYSMVKGLWGSSDLKPERVILDTNESDKIDDIIWYSTFCDKGWASGQIAEKKHNIFLKSIADNDLERFKFNIWILYSYERVSINCISWLGSEFAKFNGLVGQDEENWLAHEYPKLIEKPNVIYGQVLSAHYAFRTQREHLEKTNVLERYDAIAPLVL